MLGHLFDVLFAIESVFLFDIELGFGRLSEDFVSGGARQQVAGNVEIGGINALNDRFHLRLLNQL